jgi:hypothetical protein
MSLCPDGETGRRKGLKIPRPQGHVGSIPTPGTTRQFSGHPSTVHDLNLAAVTFAKAQWMPRLLASLDTILIVDMRPQ